MPSRSRWYRLDRALCERYRLLLLLILALGLALRVGAYFDLRNVDLTFFQPGLDSQVFLEWAGKIATGKLALDRPFFLNPLYPYFLSPILLLGGEHHLLLIRAVQVVIGLATVVLLAGTTRAVAGKTAGLGAALATATYPLLIYYEHRVMIVTLAVFLNALVLRLLARYLGRRTLRTAFLVGIPLGLSILARPNVAIFAMLLPLWFGYLAPRGEKLRTAVVHTAAVFVTTVLMILPVTLHNWFAGDDFIPVTSSMGANLYQSNNPKAWQKNWMLSEELQLNPTLIENDAIQGAERALGRSLKPSEVSSYWQGRAIRVIRENPGKASWFLLLKGLHFFHGREIPSSYEYSMDREQSSLLRWLPLTWTLIVPFMLLGVVAVTRRWPQGRPLAFLLLAYAVGLTIFYPLAHYRAPVLPASIPLAILGLGWLLRALARRRFRRLGRRLGLLLAFAVLGQLPPLLDILGAPNAVFSRSDPVIYHYNQAMFLLERGDLLQAEQSLEKAEAANPDSWFPDVGRAALAQRRGEDSLEALFLEQALEKKPDAHGARCALGRNIFHRGQRERGLRLVLQAVEEAGRDESVLATAGGLYRELGNMERALEYLARAAACSPHPRPELIANLSLTLRMLNRPREALDAVNDCMRTHSDDWLLRMERLLALITVGGEDRDEVLGEIRRLQAEGHELDPALLRYEARHR